MQLNGVCHHFADVESSADVLLRKKVRALMKARRLSQIDLASQLQINQSLLSRRLTGVQKFQITDLDALAAAFKITVPELFFDEFGQWDRRTGVDRRKGERRQQRQTIYDAKVELSPDVRRAAFPDNNGDS